MTPNVATRRAPRAVIVEDEALVAEDARSMLTDLGYEVVGLAARADEALTIIRGQRPSVVLMDIHLKDGSSGIDVSREVRRELDIPVVFATAFADAETLAKAAATDPFGYVVKPYHKRELAAALAMAMYRHDADRTLRGMERWLSMTLGSIADAVLAADLSGRVTYINAAAEAITGWSRAEAIGRPIVEVFRARGGSAALPVADPVASVIERGVTFHLTQDTELVTRSGRTVPIDDSIAPIRSADGEIEGAVVIFRDRSAAKRADEERREIEARMLEAQRLESLGVLAGGIAHDFNNLLTIILGNVSVAREMVSPTAAQPPAAELAPLLDEVNAASLRAASLSQQMLAYAGRAPRRMRAVDVSRFIGESVELLHTAIHERVSLSMDLAPGLPLVDADKAQLQQVVMNLVLNASDAIGDRGGTIAVRTYPVSDGSRRPAAVGVDVRDDGPGIPEAIRGRIFEPFFSTKTLGRGLGLSAVQGIVREHRGTIEVHSTEGVGTRFTLTFPAGRLEQAAAGGHAVAPPPRLTGRALVVDDDDAVRGATRRLLQRLGVEAIEADGLHAALDAVQRHGPFSFSVIDVTMPHASGPEVAERLRRQTPALPVVFVSGYDESDALGGTALDGRTSFVHKPFSLAALERAVRQVLEAP